MRRYVGTAGNSFELAWYGVWNRNVDLEKVWDMASNAGVEYAQWNRCQENLELLLWGSLDCGTVRNYLEGEGLREMNFYRKVLFYVSDFYLFYVRASEMDLAKQ